MAKGTGIVVTARVTDFEVFNELLKVLKEVVNDKRIIRSVREKYNQKCEAIADKAHKQKDIKHDGLSPDVVMIDELHDCKSNKGVDDGSVS